MTLWSSLARRLLPTASFVAVVASACPSFGQAKEAQDLAARGFGGVVVTAAITALVGGTGWVLAYILNSRREDRTKRLQLTIEHTSAQLRDFYAPLVALTDQLDTLAAIKDEVVRGKDSNVSRELTAAFYDSFFLPVHEEIVAILKTKVHLIEGATTPGSFVRYFEHYASEKAYWQLTKAGQDVSGMQVRGYPPDFYHDVRRGYLDVSKRYEGGLEELRHPETGWLSKLRFGARSLPASNGHANRTRHPR